jgi:predicted phosphodiesterase
MKVLIAGDIHGNLSHLRHLGRRAQERDIDRIFQVGDFGYWEHMREGVEFLNNAEKVAVAHEVTVYFLDGNHDNRDLLLNNYNERDEEGFIIVRPHVRYADRGHRWTWDRTRFIALGGAYSVDKEYRLGLEKAGSGKPERYWFSGEEMTDDDMARILVPDIEPWEFLGVLVEYERPVDVILAHDKPRSSNPAWNRKDIPECWPNQDRLGMAVRALAPKLFVHGHLHYRYRDTIMSGDDRYTRVEGLHCDPEATMHWPYDPAESWLILDGSEVSSD